MSQADQIVIVAQGGTTFQVHRAGEFLGSTEFGSIDDNGQYEQDDDEIIEHVRETFGLDESLPAIVR